MLGNPSIDPQTNWNTTRDKFPYKERPKTKRNSYFLKDRNLNRRFHNSILLFWKQILLPEFWVESRTSITCPYWVRNSPSFNPVVSASISKANLGLNMYGLVPGRYDMLTTRENYNEIKYKGISNETCELTDSLVPSFELGYDLSLFLYYLSYFFIRVFLLYAHLKNEIKIRKITRTAGRSFIPMNLGTGQDLWLRLSELPILYKWIWEKKLFFHIVGGWPSLFPILPMRPLT